MRIYKRAEFMQLPGGTIFSKGKPWAFSDLMVKSSPDGSLDFVCRSLINIDSHDSEQNWDRLEQMRDVGASFPLNEDYGRDGMFDDEDLFLVYEAADLIQLLSVVNAALALSTQK